jgi:uncharacterized protein (DUF2235 family)
MGRRIVLLSDGTGNSAAKVWRTNVRRTFEALDLSGNDQVAFYDDGVGTSTFKPWAILGGAFGFGLKRNVIDIYKFACRNYRDESDDIYGFGFSRGAFTIRVVIGLILNQGLVSADNEAELDNKAIAAYRKYRSERYHTLWPWHPEDWFRAIRNALLPIKYDKRDNRQVKHIRFVGVWDTVAAYGLPMDEMTRGVSRWIMPLELPTHTLDRERVMRACQALSLDEERTTFHPELWDEKIVPPSEFDPNKERHIADEQISQVWFAGVHSNVGGGYPDDALAYIPLVWMLNEAQRCGLKFKSDRGIRRPTPMRSKTRSRWVTRTGESTIRVRGLAAITATARASWFSSAITSIRKRKTTKSRSSVRKSTNPSSGGSGIKRTPTRRSACLPPTTSSRTTAKSSRPINMASRPARRQRPARTRRNTSGTKSGNAASSISQRSAPRRGCWHFR